MITIILSDQVFDDCTRLPEGDALVWILDSGKTTIRIDFHVFRSFNLVEWNVLGYEWDIELGEDHADFAWVGTEDTTPESDRFQFGCHVEDCCTTDEWWHKV